jgi:hypothetical protein
MTDQRLLMQVLNSEIANIDEDCRAPGYPADLRDHLATVLALEREHRTQGTNIRVQVRQQVDALAICLTQSDWQPGVPE